MKPKKPLEVGERVAAYDDGRRYTGVVTETIGGTQVWVRFDKLNTSNRLHVNQLRRLVKKERREWTGEWAKVNRIPGSSIQSIAFVPHAFYDELLELEGQTMGVQEVKRGGK